MTRDKFEIWKEWLKQAEYDLGTAEAIFKSKRYIYTVFMCHLSIEKALKGLYAKKLKEFPPKVHNLDYLCEKVGIELPKEFQNFITSK